MQPFADTDPFHCKINSIHLLSTDLLYEQCPIQLLEYQTQFGPLLETVDFLDRFVKSQWEEYSQAYTSL